MKNKQPEILAPAGSMEALTAAVRCGADAVYLGGCSFSARQNAANFTPEELGQAIEYCHLHHVKVYQAVNTLVFDQQFPALSETIRQAVQLGVDALIVQDLGVARRIRQLTPDMPLHASTQMSIHTPEGVLLAQEMGFCRVVAAREMDRQVLAECCQLSVEIEAFIHGALCMSVSGQCWMSAMIGSRSANRGLCGQACRLPFQNSEAMDGNPHALSLKDLSLIPHIPELTKMGVSSFKIEGRMKRPEYVAAAVAACRAAVDGLPPDMDTLRSVFSRSGFTDGYFSQKINADIFGFREKEDVLSASAVLPRLQELYRKESKAEAIDFAVTLCPDRPAQLQASDRSGHTVKVQGEIPQTAHTRSSDLEQAKKQLGRLGDTPYFLGEVQGEIAPDLSFSAANWNDLRRKACQELNLKRIEAARPHYRLLSSEQEVNFPVSAPSPAFMETEQKKPELRLYFPEKAPSFSVLETLISENAELLILSVSSIFHLLTESKLSQEWKDRLCVSPPRWIADESHLKKQLEQLRSEGITHLYANNLTHIRLAKERRFICHGGFGLNALNSAAFQMLQQYGLQDCEVSFEAKLSQIQQLVSPIPIGAVAYGRLPLMLTRSCPVGQTGGGCGRCGERVCSLTDRTGRVFPISCPSNLSDGRQAVEILNCDTLWLADRLPELKNLQFLTLRLDADDSPAEILNAYKNGAVPPFQEDRQITRGLYYRGIQ